MKAKDCTAFKPELTTEAMLKARLVELAQTHNKKG